MTKQTLIWLVLTSTCCVLLAACGGSEPAASTPNLADRGVEFVTLLADGEFEEATTWLDTTMTEAMPESKLREAWNSLAKLGSYQRCAGVRTAREMGFDVAYVTCDFSKGKIDVKVVFDPDGRVSGLWFVNPKPA